MPHLRSRRGPPLPRWRRHAAWRRVVGALALAVVSAAPAAAATVALRLEQRDGQPLPGAVLVAVPLDRSLPPPRPAVMDQREQRFLPHVLPVQRGARVTFSNHDAVGHHVYSFSPPKRFELYLSKGEVAEAVTFDHPGVVALGCNIHDWMLGYVLVVDSPHFVRTDREGRAELADLPAGRYRLQVWHPRIQEAEPGLRREVELGGEAPYRWRLRVELPLLPARNQQPGFDDYGS